MRWGLAAVRMLGKAPVSGGLRIAWSESDQMRLAMGENDG
jgi:hypothetical protein